MKTAHIEHPLSGCAPDELGTHDHVDVIMCELRIQEIYRKDLGRHIEAAEQRGRLNEKLGDF
jgi:hypothetical protein